MKMSGCEGLFDTYLSTERSETELIGGPLLKRRLSESDDLVVKKRQKISTGFAQCPSPSDMSSASSSSSSSARSSTSSNRSLDHPQQLGSDHPVDDDFNLPDLLREEGMLGVGGQDNKNVPLDYLLDVLWETDEFRLSIQREIAAVFPHTDDVPMESDEPRDSAEAENRIFARAKNASDYLDLAASVISFLKDKTTLPSEMESVRSRRRCSSGGQEHSSLFANECISLDKLDRFIRL